MHQQYHNPFASSDLIAPTEHRNFYDWYCLTGGVTSIDQSPFPRMVDFWFASLSFAAREKLKPDNLSGRELLNSTMVLSLIEIVGESKQ